MKRSDHGKGAGDHSPQERALQDPFEFCGRITDDFALIRDALVAWYSASPTRWAMVARRDLKFFDVAAVAIVGHALSAEAAFFRWAQIEVAAGAPYESLRAISEVDQWEPPIFSDWAVDDGFWKFLRESKTTLPDVPTTLTHFALLSANRIKNGEIHPCEGARTLSDIQKRITRDSATSHTRWPFENIGLQPFCLAAQGFLPTTFEPVSCCDALHAWIRKAAEEWSGLFGNRVVSTDDPAKWPTAWHRSN